MAGNINDYRESNTSLNYQNKELPNLLFTNLKQYFHKIDFQAIVQTEKETLLVDLNECIKYFSIYKNYGTFVYPIIKVQLGIPYEIKSLFTRYYDKLKFKFSLSQVECDIIDGTTQESTFPEDIYKDIILEANDFDKTKFQDEEEAEAIGYTDNYRVSLEMELFASDHIKISKKPIDGIYEDVDFKQLLLKLFANVPNKSIIVPPHRQTLDQVILPSLNLPLTIKYLQDIYGIYKDSYRLFFSYNRNYLIPSTFKYDEPRTDEDPLEYPNTICYVGKFSDGFIQSGCLKDDDNKVQYIVMDNTDSFSFKDESVHTLYGNEMVVKTTTQTQKHVLNDTKKNDYTTIEPETGSNNKNINNNSEFLNKTPQDNTTNDNEFYYTGDIDELDSLLESKGITKEDLLSFNGLDSVEELYNGKTLAIPTESIVTQTAVNIKDGSAFSGIFENSDSESKIKYYYNPIDNDFSDQVKLLNMNSSNVMYTAAASNIDTRFISLNKKIYLNFVEDNYEKYSGLYKIMSLVTNYQQITPLVYSSSSVFTLYKLTEELMT